METTNKLIYRQTNHFTENEENYRITTTVSLDDDYHNKICDWSVTADIRWKNKNGIYKEYAGGCCHDKIAKHCPDLAKFIPLHCCNHYGAPMYPVANGIYHIRKSGMPVAMKYLRISEQECVELYIASEDELYFKYLLFDLGIVDRWKHESDELLAELENLCGKKWVNPYKPEEGLEGWGEDDYAFYGLPLFKATAVKYGWDNPIGEDSGRERKYDSQY